MAGLPDDCWVEIFAKIQATIADAMMPPELRPNEVAAYQDWRSWSANVSNIPAAHDLQSFLLRCVCRRWRALVGSGENVPDGLDAISAMLAVSDTPETLIDWFCGAGTVAVRCRVNAKGVKRLRFLCGAAGYKLQAAVTMSSMPTCAEDWRQRRSGIAFLGHRMIRAMRVGESESGADRLDVVACAFGRRSWLTRFGPPGPSQNMFASAMAHHRDELLQWFTGIGPDIHARQRMGRFRSGIRIEASRARRSSSSVDDVAMDWIHAVELSKASCRVCGEW